MEQVEPVPLQYERKPRKRRRTSNRERFLQLLAATLSGVMLSGWHLTSLLSFAPIILLTCFYAVQLLNFLRRYRLAASRWMARPGERRILDHRSRLRTFGMKLSRRLDHLEGTIQPTPDFQSAAVLSGHDTPKLALKTESKSKPVSEKSIRSEKPRRSPIAFAWLLLLVAIGQAAYLIEFRRFQLPDSTRYPVSFAFGLIWMMVIALFICVFSIGFVVVNWRGLRVMKRTISAPGFGQRLFQRWMNSWQPRIESFETPQNDVKT